MRESARGERPGMQQMANPKGGNAHLRLNNKRVPKTIITHDLLPSPEVAHSPNQNNIALSGRKNRVNDYRNLGMKMELHQQNTYEKDNILNR